MSNDDISNLLVYEWSASSPTTSPSWTTCGARLCCCSPSLRTFPPRREPTAPRRPRARWLTPSTRRPSGSRASPRRSIRAPATAWRSGNALMLDAKEIDARIRGSFARQTIMTTLGAEIAAVRAGEVEIVLPFSDRILQQHEFIHAGAVATIADSACGY